MSTFGVVIPGRPVDTNFQQVEANKFLLTLPNADSINHVVVFLTGIQQLPADVASCIYFSLPDPSAPPTWHYLGYLTQEKPSAIYKLTNLTQSKVRAIATAGESVQNRNHMQSMSLNGHSCDTGHINFNYVQAPVLHVAQIGISIEPRAVVNQMVPAVQTSASKANSFTEFINKTASNLFNYCSSFSRPASELITSSSATPFQVASNNSSAQYVPLSVIQTWYENYTRRLSNDENFWRTLN